MPAFERLSGQDASFLVFETPDTPMNVGGPSIYEGGSLVRRDGSVDLPRIKAFIAAHLHKVQRYRQRLAYIPIENQPVWIDDERFDLDYHVRHAALPKPGSDEQLKRLAADIMARPLDRRRALWEMWIVEGLAEGRFAVVTKTHHCMVDGVSGVDLVSALADTEPKRTFEPAQPWRPRRPPSGVEMLRDDVLARLRLPFAPPARERAGDVLRSDLGRQLASIWQSVQSGVRGAANTPLNRPPGAQRRLDWLHMDLAAVKAVKARLGGTVNDVVLSTVAGAVRRFLIRRKSELAGLDFRVAIPVNVRTAEDLHQPGNRTSVWLTPLPIDERSARRRLARVSAMTVELKASGLASGTAALMKLADWVGPALVAAGTRFAARMSPYNLIITNVPGPQFPLYMLDARLLYGYPMVPLFENQGLGVALFSYDGQLCWGFNADWDLVPDLRAFVADIEASFAELQALARPATARARATGPQRHRASTPTRRLGPRSRSRATGAA